MRGGQRVAAEVTEKVRRRIHRVRLTQHLRAGGPQHALQRRSRFRGRRGGGGGRRGRDLRGEGVAVELAADGGREPFQQCQLRRHHIVWERLRQGRAEIRQRGRVPRIGGHDPGDERLHPVGRMDGAAGGADSGQRAEAGLDLGEFHAVTAEFHLRVDAPEEEMAAGGVAAHEVARAVNPPEARVRREAFRGELGPLPVAAGEAGAADPEFPRRSLGHLLPRGVEDPGKGPAHRAADADRLPRVHPVAQAGDRALGGAVVVDQRAAAGPAVGEFRGQGLAADEDQPQPGEFAGGL